MAAYLAQDSSQHASYSTAWSGLALPPQPQFSPWAPCPSLVAHSECIWLLNHAIPLSTIHSHLQYHLPPLLLASRYKLWGLPQQLYLCCRRGLCEPPDQVREPLLLPHNL